MSSYTFDDLPDEALPDINELKGDLRMLAEKVGVRAALQASELFAGTPARLGGNRRYLVRWRDKQMRMEYDKGGISVVELSRKYGTSERHAYNILGAADPV